MAPLFLFFIHDPKVSCVVRQVAGGAELISNMV
jgi:hypothetical protein